MRNMSSIRYFGKGWKILMKKTNVVKRYVQFIK